MPIDLTNVTPSFAKKRKRKMSSSDEDEKLRRIEMTAVTFDQIKRMV